jgi:hypothetical protein
MKMRKKADLPSKTCACCGRPFVWRKKWAKVWDEVRYCSDRCKGEKRMAKVCFFAEKSSLAAIIPVRLSGDA